MSQSTLMNAALAEVPGEPLRLVRIPIPTPEPGQVLVRIRAAGVNPIDVKIQEGKAAHARQPLPAILGTDLAGQIVALGAGVTSLRAGDEVYGLAGGVGGVPGSLAEYAAVSAELLAPTPKNLGLREAASLPLAFITAWEGLVDRVQVHSGQQVLVQGGAGGVGQIALQLARAFGATVFATASASNRAFLEQRGATAIDYRAESVADYVARCTAGRGFDVVFDTVGGSTLDASFAAVARFGHVSSSLGWGTHALAPLSFRGASYSGVFTLLPLISGEGRAHHGEIMREATRLVEAGQLLAHVDPRRFTLQTVNDAYQAVADGAAVGKLVVDVS